MILPKALALSLQLVVPVAGGDGVPQLNVEQVCKGIAEQGGVTFRDPQVEQEKKNCIDSEKVIRERAAQVGQAQGLDAAESFKYFRLR